MATFYIVDNDVVDYRDGYLTSDEDAYYDITCKESASFIAKTFEADSLEDAKQVLHNYNHYADRPVTVLHCCSTGCCISTYDYYHDSYKCIMRD